MRIGSQQDLASEFGGTFVSPESGARGDSVLASYFCCRAQREDEDRVNRNDRLRRFVAEGELADRSDEFETEYDVDEEDDELFLYSVDRLAGPRFIKPETLSPQPIYDMLRLGGPAYVVRAYEMAGERGRFDILNRLPDLVARLKSEGTFSLSLFKQTKIELNGRRFSASAILRGHAADELRVIGPEGGIACQILKALGVGAC